MSRRGENIRKRTDGRWEGRYKVTNTVTGKSKYCSVYGKSYQEAKKKLLNAKQCLSENNFPNTLASNDKIIYFDDVALEWLLTIKDRQKYPTFIKYSNIYKKHIQPFWGSLSLNEIRSMDVVNCENYNTDVSYSIKKSIFCVMNQILKYTSYKYEFPPYTFVFNHRKKALKSIEVLTKSEQKRLIGVLSEETDIYKIGIFLCMTTGLRLGELCALKWEDIDFENKLLHISRTVQRIAVQNAKNKTVLWEGEPKSFSSKRSIPLADSVIKSLTVYKKMNGYIFKATGPMEPRTYQNKFSKYLMLAGIPHRNFHILRHTFATNCIDNGADIKSLSEILGHSDVKITLNKYVHPTIETKRQHINSLAIIYGQYMGQREQY